MQKYLKLFGLKQDFNEEELKISYRSLCSKYHPDKTNGRTTALFQEVQVGKRELDEDLKSRKNLFANRSNPSSDYVKSYTSFEEYVNSKSKEFKGFEKQKAYEPAQPTERDIINHLRLVNEELRSNIASLNSDVMGLKDLAFSYEMKINSVNKYITSLEEDLKNLNEKNEKLKNRKWWKIFKD